MLRASQLTSGKERTAAVKVQISAGFPLLSKFLVVWGTLVLLDWERWLSRARGRKVVGGKVKLTC